MKLIKFDNWKLTITEEALLVKAFGVLWKRDKTKDKSQVLRDFSFIYFVYDPRSDYMYLTDEQDRIENVKKSEGLPKNWKPDKDLLIAVEQYKQLTQTTSSLLLADTKITIDKIRTFLREIDLTAEDEKGKPKYTINSIMNAVKDIPRLSEELSKAEMTLNREIEENGRIRGAKVKKILEDDLTIFTTND